MGTYLLQAEIDPSKLPLLLELRPRHLAFIVAHRDRIVFGGPTRVDGGPPETMVIAFRAESLAAAEAFLDDEPYRQHGAFRSLRVRPWSQVLPEAQPGSLQAELDAYGG